MIVHILKYMYLKVGWGGQKFSRGGGEGGGQNASTPPKSSPVRIT